MRIVADGGGTKTDWKIIPTSPGREEILSTDGINPSVMSLELLEERVATFFRMLIAKYPEVTQERNSLKFYGAGCATPQAKENLKRIIIKNSGIPFESVYIASDLEGAAMALFGKTSGIACILGTGSASCLYNGEAITDSVPAMGYLLGDEGSGAFMGRMLVNSYFKRNLSAESARLLEDCHDMTVEEVLRNTYREGKPGQYLASFVPFLKKYEDLEDIGDIIDNSLKLFFENNVLKYKDIPVDTPIGFVGGVACAFTERLTPLSEEYGFRPVRFLKKPIEGL